MSGFRLNLRDGVGTALGEKTVSFTFDGKTYEGREGDTLASALIANGVSIVGRSFKYHRPRGIFTAGSEEPNALITLHSGGRTEPNIRATEVELYEGLVARSQNRWPSVQFDLMAVNQLAGKAFSAGFYYKTFMGPARKGHKATQFWWFCEQFIRRAAGLGRGTTIPDHYARMNAWCDVLIVGSGAAGHTAAHRAAQAGARIILCEESPQAAGALNSSPDFVEGEPAREWSRQAVEELKALDNVTVLTRTTIQSYFDDNTFFAVERVTDHLAHKDKTLPRQRAWNIRANSAVIATGALERPIVFAGNDRPGVMLADAARRYAVDYGTAPGRAVAVFTNNNTGWLAARDMARAGVIITAIIDVRTDIDDDIRALGEECLAVLHTGSAVTAAKGMRQVSGIVVAKYNEITGEIGGETKTIACDCVAVSGGWSPAFHLTSQQGGKPV